MKPSTRNITKGAGREVKGGLKEAGGRITRNTRMKVGGKIQKTAGRAQRKLGQAERDAEKDLDRDVRSRRRRARA
jgi:uncharacterized protein YjbJ (UPF0337 family)